MKVWVLTGDKMETAAATCYASKLFRRNTQILELTTKRTEEQSLHDVLFDLSRTVLRQHGGMTRDTFSGCVFMRDSIRLTACQPCSRLLRVHLKYRNILFHLVPSSSCCTDWYLTDLLFVQFIRWLYRLWSDHRWSHPVCGDEARSGGLELRELQRDLPRNLPQLQRRALLSNGTAPESTGTTDSTWIRSTCSTEEPVIDGRESEVVKQLLIAFFVFLDCEADQSLQGAPDHAGHWRWG